jgi:hypothetical protein
MPQARAALAARGLTAPHCSCYHGHAEAHGRAQGTGRAGKFVAETPTWCVAPSGSRQLDGRLEVW